MCTPPLTRSRTLIPLSHAPPHTCTFSHTSLHKALPFHPLRTGSSHTYPSCAPSHTHSLTHPPSHAHPLHKFTPPLNAPPSRAPPTHALSLTHSPPHTHNPLSHAHLHTTPPNTLCSHTHPLTHASPSHAHPTHEHPPHTCTHRSHAHPLHALTLLTNAPPPHTSTPHPPHRMPRAEECAGSDGGGGGGVQPLPRSRRSKNSAASSRRCTLIIRTRSMGTAGDERGLSTLPSPADRRRRRRLESGTAPGHVREAGGPAPPQLGALSAAPTAPSSRPPRRPAAQQPRSPAGCPRAVCLPLRPSTGEGREHRRDPPPPAPSSAPWEM